MKKLFPARTVIAIAAIIMISIGGAYALYRIIETPPPFKSQDAAPEVLSRPGVLLNVTPAVPGYQVIQLRASVEMSPDTGTVAFDIAMEGRGFMTECPGTVVPVDHRKQTTDYWSEEEGALAEAKTLVCLPTTSNVPPPAFTDKVSDARVVLDEDDAELHPLAVFEAKGTAVFVHTDKGGYLLYAGGISAKSCDSGCDAGIAAGVSVTKVSRPLNEDRFVFAVPAGDSKILSVVAALAVIQ